ncbi:tectonin beta-propeller repeat-containing protein 1-like [Astyanax mexicanus]|uniref:Tectonin beta-propeller repeat-containing protein 1-like n=1 Tax=Astyanax mexicanus TaxID=7994 RepID=A0A8T2KZU5_ASTMX|nr:tectonin beta-propeller repeat-containing protein 1-like [Astyanax mexicanus]
MPGSLLWAVDVYGRVFRLCSTGGRWERSKDVLLELKRVTAAEQGCWGIGCDHQVYLNVLPSDVAIRHQEETYENQRWNPVEGYTDTLLPTDRWQWTDESGQKPQPLHSFHLPSDNWEWEGDWYVDDESCGRESTATGGWEYAVDFPATFTKEKKWNSCVRRRRWLRYRRYKARGSWAKVPLDRGQPPPEPFTDITCGGWEISDSPEKHICLWAVSQQGKVWFRTGVKQQNPEGTAWENIPVPKEVSQISAGPGDLLWAVLWDGQLLVRTGISKDCPKGVSWVTVDPPSKAGAIHTAVGVNVVWAVTKDNKVWFRRGVNSHNSCGLGWISIGGEMVMISVGPNDQVWGVGSEDRTIYFRHGVTPTEVTGKTWAPVCAQLDSSHSTNRPSDGSFFSGQLTGPSQGSVLSCEDSDVPRPHIPKITSDSFISALVADRSAPPEASAEAPSPATPDVQDQDDPQEAPVEGDAPAQPPVLQSSQLNGGELPWSNVDLEELKSPPASAVQSSVATYHMDLGAIVEQEEAPPWAWITGGGCTIDSNSTISWLESADTGLLSPSITPALGAAAAQGPLAEKALQEKEKTLEKSVSVRKGVMRWWRDWPPQQWEEVGVTLEQVRGGGAPRDDILYISYTHIEERRYLYAVIREVTALVPVLWESLFALAVYTAERTRQRWPILLATESHHDLENWLSLLSESCCESRALRSPPSKQALWALTSKGDIMVHDPLPSLEAPAQYLPCDQMFWRQVPGHLLCVESNSLGVVWGIGYDHTAWVYTGGCRGNQTQGTEVSPHAQTDVRNVYIYENQRWNPVTGYTDKGLPTDRYMWSDALGLKECTKENTTPPSPLWTWVSDWAVDYSTPGGADKEGWQYAADFPVTFHGYKTMKDFVRRRRWVRKCKITLAGPWQKVPPIPLIDVTILPCLAQSSLEQVPVWAISEKGDVLCRLGVNTQNPAGSSWLHVGTDQPFKSICIGGGHQVWAIARDGAVFYRGSVSSQNPAGECWYHIPSPPRQNLRQVSVGRTSVYAVDENCNLWYRQGLTPSYPQGSAWELISNNVIRVSVGPLDQVWIIADKVPGYPTESSGTVCHRLGVRPMQPKGLSWDFGIGGGWEHLSVRGNSTEAQRPVPRSPLPSRSQAQVQTQVNGNAAGC